VVPFELVVDQRDPAAEVGHGRIAGELGIGELLHLDSVMVRDSGPLQRKCIAIHTKRVLLLPAERAELCLECPPLSAKFFGVAHGKSLLWFWGYGGIDGRRH
jgi:hypothetical protein